MKKILVLLFSNLKHDARVSRQVNWLKKNNDVTIVCFDAEESTDIKIIKISQTNLTPARKLILAILLILKQYSLAYRVFHNYDFLKKQLAADFDIIIANDIDTLPLAFEIKPDAKIILDAHEYAPRHFENSFIWRLFFQSFYIFLCEKYIPKTSGMLTVGEGLANEYEKHFNVKPLIITNATRYYDVQPSAVEENKIRLIHHGIANQSRKLELMLDMMDHLDERFTLDMILMTSDYASSQTKSYITSLKGRASLNPRIKILPSVKSHEIVQTINKYDMGVFLIPPINFNYANTLPNKLFDFIQARLAIAIGPTPEMAAIVDKFNIGVVSENFEPLALASKLNALTFVDVKRFKNNAAIAALEYNAEKNGIIFSDLINSL